MPSVKQSLWTSMTWLMLMIVVAGGLLMAAWIWQLNQEVQTRFEGQRWQIPAKVYARPLELTPGALTEATLAAELALLGYRMPTQQDQPGQYLRQGNIWQIHSRPVMGVDGLQPAQKLRLQFDQGVLRSVASSLPSGLPIRYLEPLHIGGIYGGRGEDRLLVRLSEVPPVLVDALIAIEDRDFYQHRGLSWRGLLRATVANVRAGRVVQGGSTLTQQLVKNLFLTDERSVDRKLREAVMARLLEWHYSKEQILETYLNEVHLGQSGSVAIHGFGLAAIHYFGRPLAELTLPDLALLVGMVKGPSQFHPRRQPERALARRQLVLRVLAEQSLISQPRLTLALSAPLGVTERPLFSPNRHPDFMDVVRRQLARQWPDGATTTGEGLRVMTTLDPQVQQAAEEALRTGVSVLRDQPRVPNQLQGALIAANPQTGAVEALVGGADVFLGFNRAIDATRQIGSLFKPVIAAAALRSGRFHPGSPVEDAPVTLQQPDGTSWTPQNSDRISHGTVPLQEALAQSYNQAAVRLGLQLGVPEVQAEGRLWGLSADSPPYPSLLLGSMAESPWRMLQMYQTLAAGGVRQPLHVVTGVLSAEGHVLRRHVEPSVVVLPPAESFQLSYLLQQVMRSGTGQRASAALPGLMLAGKTGTTNDLRDSWFAGQAGRRVAVVWLGDDRNQPIALSGSQGALPIWIRFMQQSRPTPLQPSVPSDIVFEAVDPQTGWRTQPACRGAIVVPLAPGNRPTEQTNCLGGRLDGLIENLLEGVRGLWR